jgi:CheY-like chemotaxis protein
MPLFVATTAYATRDMRNACLEAGFSSFLAKPVSETALRAIVEGTTATTPDAPSFQASSPARPPSPLEAMAAGDPARLRSLQADCLQDLDTDLDRLSGAVARGDLPGARGHAHRIISHGALLGEDAIRSAAGALQDAADRGDASGLRPALAALQAAVETFRERWNRVGA